MSETSGGEVLARMLQAEVSRKSSASSTARTSASTPTCTSSVSRSSRRGTNPVRHTWRRLCTTDRQARRLHGQQRSGRREPAAGTRGRERGRQSRARDHQLPSPADRLPRPRGAYQAFDQVGAIKHFAKWSNAVVSFDRVAELGRTAIRNCWKDDQASCTSTCPKRS